MPLYECRCEPCDLTFEVLAPLSASRTSQRCPECGRRSRRVISAVTFAPGKGGTTQSENAGAAASDVTQLRVPPAARLCWMDDRSAARFAAYKLGRGAEYDDKIAGREELRKQRGIPDESSASHPHQHSPLADPTVLARRKAAARKTKIAESKEITRHRNSPA
jgi:putative FmdB family regulatory protein